MFDFAAALAAAAKDAKSTALEALIMGPSGAGKSTLCGTIGVPTLYIYCGGENHGVKSAKTYGARDLLPIRLDYWDQSEMTAQEIADRSLEFLNEILTSKEFLKAKNIKAIAIDGATEIENLIRASTKFKEACATKKGEHNTFEEPRAVLNQFRPILNQLKWLQREMGMHFVMTCIVDMKAYNKVDGAIVECLPRLSTYSVAEGLVQQFGDILLVGEMEKNGVKKHKLQFMTDIVKESKDQLKQVKKCLNFSPRVAGLTIDEEGLKNIMEADLEEIVKLKQKHFRE